MKLRQAKDLTPLREQARMAVMRDFALATRSPLAAAFAQKAEAARRWKVAGELSYLLSQEAALRGTSVDELADLVLSRAAEFESVVADAELSRQRALLAIEAASTERELLQIIGAPAASI